MDKIEKWEVIERDFLDGIEKSRKGIVIGNGASIAIDKRFSYRSLYEYAKDGNLFTDNIRKIFEHLETEDFELVLRMLWHTYRINEALGIINCKASEAYNELRDAFINAVQKIHVGYIEVSKHLLTIASFLKKFDTVISLNYDLIIYWAMLVGNENWKKWFKDCFVNGKFQYNWEEYLQDPHPQSDGSTLVFYPHGNLALASRLRGDETKIAKRKDESENLITKVVDSWKKGEYLPLFVSEGTSEQKLLAIKRSPYLNNVYEYALKNIGDSIVIFGWSIGDNDDHILKALCKTKELKNIAVSVVHQDKNNSYCDRIKEKIMNAAKPNKNKADIRDINVRFFDGESAGCWINSPTNNSRQKGQKKNSYFQ